MSYSYSSMDTYNKCPFKYKLMYQDGYYIFQNTVATEFGTAMHHAEESIGRCIIENKEINYDEIIRTFKDDIFNVKLKYPMEFFIKDKNGLNYEEKRNLYIQNIKGLELYIKNNPTFKIIDVEKSFQFTYRGVEFKGAIDRIIYDEATNTYFVEDVKSYSGLLKKTRFGDELHNPLQFVVYSMAMREMYGEDVKIRCIYDLPLLNAMQECEMESIENQLKDVDEVMNNINDGKFIPHPTALCYWCQFSDTNPHQVEEGKGKCFYWSCWTPTDRSFEFVCHPWEGMELHQCLKEDYEYEREHKNEEM